MEIKVLALCLLFGSAAAAQTLTPSTLSFGNQVEHQISAPLTATYKNTLSAAISIEPIILGGTNKADFALGGNCPFTPDTLAAGKSCSITVTFTPSEVAAESAVMSVIPKGNGSTQIIQLSGTGLAPITLSSASLAFGNQAAGTQSAALTETLTNGASTPLTVNNIAVSGPFIRSGGTCPSGTGQVAGGASCTIFVAFSPTAVAAASGTLTVTDNAPGSPQTAGLTGNGITPVTISPTSVTFPAVAVGNTSTATSVTLTNYKNVPLTFTSIAASGAFQVSNNTCGTSVAAGATCAVGVTFSPNSLGAAGGALTFTDAAVNSPQTVSLSGTGTPPVTLSAKSLTFASTTLGGKTAAQTITLTNALTTSLPIGAISASGDFAVASNTCGSKVGAGLQCQIGVTFAPTVVGSRSGALTLNFTAFGSPSGVTLTGTGNATGLTTISVAPVKTTIPLGTAQQYSASGKFASGTLDVTASVTWSSSTTATASISTSGMVKSVAQGSTSIQAVLGSVHGNTALTVSAPALVSIAVTPATPSITLGNAQQFTATGTYTDKSTQNITSSVKWSSSSTAVATISASGLASAAGLGSTTIQASSGSINCSAALTVTAGFELTGSLSTPRFAHTATMLNNGLVLIAGGVGLSGNSLGSAELYNPVTGTSTPTGNLNTARAFHTATLLNNGTVLIAGGCSGCSPGVNGASLAAAEIYNPVAGTFSATGSMLSAREYHTATLLNNGTVLMAGGLAQGASLSTAELYNPATGAFAATASMNDARYWHRATLLNDGTVLITGGQANSATLAAPVGEIYNSTTGLFTITPSAMVSARSSHTATLMNNGIVLIAGGNGSSGPIAEAELYNPVGRTFSVTGSLNTARAFQQATLLNNGRVLLSGGEDANGNSLAGTELFDPTQDQFILTGALHTPRFGHTGTLLSNGNVLAGGGVEMSGGNLGTLSYTAAAEQYEPAMFTPPGLISISVGPSNPTLPEGTAQNLVATGTFSGGTQTVASVTWNSSNSSVAPIGNDSTNSGRVYAAATGSTAISACAGSICGATNVTVGPPALVAITITPGSISIPSGVAQQFTAMGTYTDGSTQNLTASATWTSSATSIATINSAGLTATFAVGPTTITASSGSVQTQITLTVTPAALNSISVAPPNASIALGLQQQFTATGTYSDGSMQNLTGSVTWSSSSKAAATISGAGLATSAGQGGTTITATFGGMQVSAGLTVTAPALISITVTPANASLAAGLQQQFTATGTYTDLSTKNLSASANWSSSNMGAATINASGFANALAQGGTTIQATVGSVGGSTNLTVNPPALVSLAVTPATPSINLGFTQQFTATGTYTDNSTQNLTGSAAWSSSATSVASINSAGLASATGIGVTNIQATSGSISGSTKLTVNAGFVVTGSLVTPRFAHTATMLNNGLILIAGGVGVNGNSLGSAELYNPTTGLSASTGNLNIARAWHTATLLNNGMVLIAGGCSGCSPGVNGASLSSAEIYDPSTGTFTAAGNMTSSREYHTGTLLNNGLVLIAGGLSSGASLATAELYNPANGSFAATGSLNNARYWHAATFLNDGTVLITGGQTNAQNPAPAAGEIYNASTGAFTLTSSGMLSARSAHTATLLNNGIVLIAGGNGPSGTLAEAELYDPVAGIFSATGSLNTARSLQQATLMNNGRVLLSGGLDANGNSLASAELFDSTKDMFIVTGSLHTARFGDTATLLNSGMVLAAGGASMNAGNLSNVTYLASAEQYEPATLSPPNLVSISLSPANPLVPEGASQNFVATGMFSSGSPQTLASLSWSSSNSAVASVGDDVTNAGATYAVAPGSATISACAGSICGSTLVTVGPPVLLSITVTPASGSTPAGLTQQFTATGTYTDGSTKNLTASVNWSSSASSVATISASGLGSTFIQGGTTIQASLGAIQGSTLLTVTAPVLVSIAITPAMPSVALGLQQQFAATGTYTDGTVQSLTASVAWSSSRAAATINSAGLATSAAQGSTTIMASLGAVQGNATLTVTAAALVSIAVTPANSSIALGLQQQFVATGTYTDGSTLNVTASASWSSSAINAATITAGGLASSVAQGGTAIQAAVSSIKGSTLLTVNAPALASISVTPANILIPAGTSQQFTATGTYTDSSTQNLTNSVTWNSSAGPLATINAAGLATSVTTGPTTISAVMGAVTGSTTLTMFVPASFYVAVNGNDQWSGTLPAPNGASTDGPFASVARAQSAVRNMLSGNPGQSVSVMLRNGVYYLAQSTTNPGILNFTSADSGTAAAPVSWLNYPDETPVVSGGIPVGNNWTNVSGSLWQRQLPAGTQPFEYLFYNGQRRLRSRLASSTGTGYYMNNGACYSTATGQTVALSQCNLGAFFRVSSVMTPNGVNAGCPSVTSSDGTQTKCLDRFGYNPSDPIAQWINLNPAASVCGSASNPYPAGDIELTLFDAWTVDIMRISCVDTTKHIIYLTGATKGNSTEYNLFGPTPGHRYMVENTLDAFEAAQSSGETGIWFLDRSTSPWTLNYIAASNENPNTDNVVIAQMTPATTTGGSLFSATNLSYVIFQGITFEVDNFIPAAGGFSTDENGEGTLPATLDCESCQNVTFDSVVVRHTSASGLQIASTAGNSGRAASNDVIQNSAFYDIGAAGIHIGHHPLGTDKAANVVQFLTIQNNIIQGYSRIFANGEGIAQGNGHDMLYSHNDITDGYHAGISICLLGCPSQNFAASGVNITTQYNHIWNIIQGITSDGGALYYNVGGNSGSGTGNKILNNLVHDVTDSSIIDINVAGAGYGGHGLYFDNRSAGIDAENNVVYHVAGSTVYLNDGPGNGQVPDTVKNNILAYGRVSMFEQQTPWPQGCGIAPSPQVSVTNNIFYFDLNDSAGFYVTTGCADSCGLPYNQFQNFQANLYWRTDGQFSTYSQAFHVMTNPPSGPSATTCGVPANPQTAWTFLNFSHWQSSEPVVGGGPLPVNEDAGGTATVNPGFGNSGLPADYQLSLAPVSGFNFAATNDTIQNAGRSNPVIVPPMVPETYPTYSFTQF